jgi:hypothetical protein
MSLGRAAGRQAYAKYIPASRPFVSSQGPDFAVIIPSTDIQNESAGYRVVFLWALGHAASTTPCEEAYQEMLGAEMHMVAIRAAKKRG